MKPFRAAGTIDSGGFQLQYIIEGDGSPILVIGSALYDERVFSRELRKTHKWFFVDHRGFGAAPKREVDNSAFNLDVLLDDIETMRRQLSLKDFVIVGHSGHAFLAIEYAKKYPTFVKGVVMTGCGPSNSDERRKASVEYFERTASPDRRKSLEKGMASLVNKIEAEPEKRFVHYCLCAGAQGWYDHTFDAAPLWDGLTTNMQMFDFVWGVVFRDIDIRKGLDKLDKPVFLALGRFDYLTGPPELWNDVKPHFRNLTETIFEQSAHCPQYEQTDEFNNALLTWLYVIEPN
jgi:proline iminopeptidase